MTASHANTLRPLLLGLLCCGPLLQGCVDRSMSQPPDRAPAIVDDGVADNAVPDPMRDADALRTARVAAITPNEALDARSIGKRVRWAGAVHHITRSDTGACLTMLYAASGPEGAPAWAPEPTYQTFEACVDGAYDPALVHALTNATIIGRISGKTTIGMGGGSAVGPTIRIEQLYRWSDCLEGDDSPICRTGLIAPDAAP